MAIILRLPCQELPIRNPYRAYGAAPHPCNGDQSYPSPADSPRWWDACLIQKPVPHQPEAADLLAVGHRLYDCHISRSGQYEVPEKMPGFRQASRAGVIVQSAQHMVPAHTGQKPVPTSALSHLHQAETGTKPQYANALAAFAHATWPHFQEAR